MLYWIYIKFWEGVNESNSIASKSPLDHKYLKKVIKKDKMKFDQKYVRLSIKWLAGIASGIPLRLKVSKAQTPNLSKPNLSKPNLSKPNLSKTNLSNT